MTDKELCDEFRYKLGVKVGKGMYGSWKEKYLVYKKAKKILDGEKKIKI